MDYRDAPLITIGLVACNAKDTVERAVRSAVRQSYPSLDILVIDDASTDGTGVILDQMAQRHGDVRVIRNDASRGIAACRNQIIEQAQGAFIAFFDARDESLPQRLIRQYVRLTDYEDAFARGTAVLCHTAQLVNGADGKKRVVLTIGCAPDTLAPHGLPVAEYFLLDMKLRQGGAGAMTIGTQMARKSVYRKLGGFDETLSAKEDMDFVVRAALDGGHFVGVPETAVIRTDSDIRRKNDHAEKIAVMEKHRAFIEAHGDFTFFRDWKQAEYAWENREVSTLAKEALALGLRHPHATYARLKQRAQALKQKIMPPDAAR
jgi:glycosyltransferase involved in cell wall biosynthesis